MSRFTMTTCVLVVMCVSAVAVASEPSIDLSGYRAECGVGVTRSGDGLVVRWRIGRNEEGSLRLNLRPGGPLLQALGVAGRGTILEHADPVTLLLVGERRAPAGRPPAMSVFNTFFDSPAQRPYESHRGRLAAERITVRSAGSRATIAIEPLEMGPFFGRFELTFYRDAPLVHAEAVVRTSLENRAILYDAGLAFAGAAGGSVGWIDVEGARCSAELANASEAQAVKVRGRSIAIETAAGSVAAFPPPHQYFFPRDLSTNLATVWYGRGRRGLEPRLGFGIGQVERGGGAFAPWFNAPPGSDQRLGVFYLISAGPAGEALAAVAEYTHHDRFPQLAGYHTFTPHWHLAVAAAARERAAQQKQPITPEYVAMFRNMGVEIVQLAEFHGDGHPRDPGSIRLAEMKTLFDECRRLSSPDLVFLPGEEANFALGKFSAGREAGHWVYLFPHALYWTMARGPNQPFRETLPDYGEVYHVGDGGDMVRLLNEQKGLAWTSHPRIKGSSWTPDIYHEADFYRSDVWLGGAWKAMPADLSLDCLGKRALDLLDDMANWGDRKYLLGEVDVFRLDHTHELYAHMNINYIKLSRLPRWEDGWGELVEALRRGRFFTTTGEVLIERFTLDGKESGDEAQARPGAELVLGLRWTLPMRFVAIVSGDGQAVYRERIELVDTGPQGARTLRLRPRLTGRRWVRAEAWDVATDGAFTQPIWLVPPS